MGNLVNTNMFDNNKAFNLCVRYQDLYYSFELYKKYARELKNLKNVFLTYSVFSPGFELQKIKDNYHMYYYNYVFGIPFKYQLCGGGGTLNKELQIIEYVVKKHYCLPVRFSGYTNEIHPIVNKDIKTSVLSHLKHAFRDKQQEEYITELCKMASENNHNLYLIVLPRSPEYIQKLKEVAEENGYNYEEIFNPLYRISKEYNIKVINHFDDKRFRDDDFSDTQHLVPAGAIKYTNILMKELQIGFYSSK